MTTSESETLSILLKSLYTALPMYELIIFSGGFIVALLFIATVDYLKEKAEIKE